MGIWDLLGIERTTDEKAIKRAYAQKLKIYHPEDDPEGFLRLRSAYQQALEDAKWPEETADEETWRPVATFDPPFDEKPESAEPMWSDDYFIEDFTVIYADFFMRVDVKCWENYFAGLSFAQLKQLKGFACGFLNENNILPMDVWRHINSQLDLDSMPGFKWSFELRSDHCLPFDCFERASGCDFDRYTRLRFEAYCALENADFVKAVELARMARRMFEKDGSVCRLEGIGCSSLGDTAHAFEAFSAAIALNGRDIDSLLYRGYIFLERDEYIAALRDFNRCLGLDAGCLDAAKGAVRALIGLKKPKPAQERLIKLRKAYPCDLELDLLLCKVAPKTMSDIMAQKTSGKIQVKRPKLWVDIITAILILAGIMASGIVISLVVILIDSIIKSL